jgi:hypothetical protein
MLAGGVSVLFKHTDFRQLAEPSGMNVCTFKAVKSGLTIQLLRLGTDPDRFVCAQTGPKAKETRQNYFYCDVVTLSTSLWGHLEAFWRCHLHAARVVSWPRKQFSLGSVALPT